MVKAKAFSLIEVMFVVVLLAIISIALVSYLNQESQEKLAQKTAGEMQQWLQATQNFYKNEDKWPLQWSDLKGQYLPESLECSTLILPRNMQRNTDCQGFGDFQLSLPSGTDVDTAPYIILTTPVPSEMIGKEIVKYLPNSKYQPCDSSSGYCVTTNQVVPGTFSLEVYRSGLACSPDGNIDIHLDNGEKNSPRPYPAQECS